MLWDSKLSSGASCFPLIILEMFLPLDWSPPVVNSIDWTWFGKAHTCLYKLPQLTVHVRAKTKPWGWWNCQESAETRLCRGTYLEKGTKKCCSIEWPLSFLNEKWWRHQDSSKSWPPGYTEQSGEKGLGQGGDQEPDGHWQSCRVPLWRLENLPEGQPSLQHSNNQAFMVEWPDGSHSSLKGTWQPTWSLSKCT